MLGLHRRYVPALIEPSVFGGDPTCTKRRAVGYVARRLGSNRISSRPLTAIGRRTSNEIQAPGQRAGNIGRFLSIGRRVFVILIRRPDSHVKLHRARLGAVLTQNCSLIFRCHLQHTVHSYSIVACGSEIVSSLISPCVPRWLLRGRKNLIAGTLRTLVDSSAMDKFPCWSFAAFLNESMIRPIITGRYLRSTVSPYENEKRAYAKRGTYTTFPLKMAKAKHGETRCARRLVDNSQPWENLNRWL